MSKKDEFFINGVDTKAIFDEMVLSAENDSTGHPKCPELSVANAKEKMKQRFVDMLDELEDEVVEEVWENWNCDE